MIQINLLPDVKTKYIKAQRSKRLVLVSSVAVSGVALGIVVLLASVVYGAQKIQLSHYDNEIKKNSAELNKIDGLSKILTVQNQLTAISGLHAAKPVTSRIFTFLPAITPSSVQISSLQLDLAQSTMTISGTANSIGDVNKFVDTLKFTKYTTDTDETAKPAFTAVVLTSFASEDAKAAYSITLKFDPALFDSANKSVSLVVPKITSTRSETESPDALFKSGTQ